MAGSLINFIGRWRAYDVNGVQITYNPGDVVIFTTNSGIESTYLATKQTTRTPLSNVSGGWLPLGSSGIVSATGGTGGRISFTYSSTPPASPLIADQWFDSTSGRFFIYMNDENSDQWVEIASIGERGPVGPTGPTGPTGSGVLTYSNTFPPSPLHGDRWFDTNTGLLFTYMTDESNTQWVQIF